MDILLITLGHHHPDHLPFHHQGHTKPVHGNRTHGFNFTPQDQFIKDRARSQERLHGPHDIFGQAATRLVCRGWIIILVHIIGETDQGRGRVVQRNEEILHVDQFSQDGVNGHVEFIDALGRDRSLGNLIDHFLNFFCLDAIGDIMRHPEDCIRLQGGNGACKPSIIITYSKGVLGLHFQSHVQNGLDILEQPVRVVFRKEIIDAFPDQLIRGLDQETRVGGCNFPITSFPIIYNNYIGHRREQRAQLSF